MHRNGLGIRRRLGALAAPAVVAVLAVAASSASAQQLAPITFTTQQANAGRGAFADNCASCHGAALQGAGGPALTGAPFATRLGQSAGALYAFISVNMPYDNPGGLTPPQYLSLVAFLAQSNGMVAGMTPLPADPDVLNGIGFRQ